MATAKYWITNSRLPLWLPKPKNTLSIQTWHGTPLKKISNDMDEVHMPDTSTNKYKPNFLKEARKWDYLISPNSYSTEIFKRAFNF
ncbi:CDP-glycerol--glycerophosphate glycerophosphotransferase [Bacillus atrophaeus]|uniref:CDP-glycerol:polyglycerol phosphate glycero-phosphotransferase (Poly(Glycerol phosphate) polymerase) n=1 Tax=Bacillus atrophaeus (strain 1942) TaxID=720555 RepID=A0ABM5M4A1_BACA1|nr:CDP-glycerol--glycerophosphate glycerophosphotransferase [Bacillus atrophaeus]AMR64283.1 CDP-glycerol--glycerophosphate glycerophosphotransferase [Bacillus subtilis subsp. globigii]ADP34857.1 CDP-glycerol:polyglycerol phosphate glycero-phosphotransferase (poly(glycerol phosphate) polymerase) [Bacillus atrophaeus 1942]EIM09937.1 CDP-glycerol:poly(glycerophosphate) glycerophosphotransferase [Bacillus atrophaeus C89]MBG9758782.1 CDP-glycerol:glycerophosphate glycerophosphotransferase [Bacillus 